MVVFTTTPAYHTEKLGVYYARRMNWGCQRRKYDTVALHTMFCPLYLSILSNLRRNYWLLCITQDYMSVPRHHIQYMRPKPEREQMLHLGQNNLQMLPSLHTSIFLKLSTWLISVLLPRDGAVREKKEIWRLTIPTTR